MHRNISRIISDVCKKEGIDYKSGHLLFADSARIGEIILELGSISDEVSKIGERHNIIGIQKLLEDDLKIIGELEHSLRNLAQKIKHEKKTK